MLVHFSPLNLGSPALHAVRQLAWCRSQFLRTAPNDNAAAIIISVSRAIRGVGCPCGEPSMTRHVLCISYRLVRRSTSAVCVSASIFVVVQCLQSQCESLAPSCRPRRRYHFLLRLCIRRCFTWSCVHHRMKLCREQSRAKQCEAKQSEAVAKRRNTSSVAQMKRRFSTRPSPSPVQGSPSQSSPVQSKPAQTSPRQSSLVQVKSSQASKSSRSVQQEKCKR